MPIDVDLPSILAGPRGRRVCLELARDLGGQAVHEVLFWLSHRFDPDPSGKAWLTFDGRSQSQATRDADAQAAATGVPDLLDAIAAVDLGRVTARAIDAAFEHSVSVARYWQPCEGNDVVAALPEVAAALAPLAETVENHPSTAWWSDGLRAAQWAVQWDTHDSTAPVDIGDLTTLTTWRQNTVAGNARAARERPDDPAAAWSGQWWSKPWRMTHTTGGFADGTPAGVVLVEDPFSWELATAVGMSGAGHVLEITSAEDWAALCRQHPLDVTAEVRQDWFRVTGRDGTWVIPDWLAVADEWDGVHLSAHAYLTAATRLIHVDADRATVIAGWDPDATYWLTSGVRETGVRTGWRRDRDANRWVRA